MPRFIVPRLRRGVAWGAFLAFTWSSTAGAFCRTRVCESTRGGCEFDVNGCSVDTPEVYWRSKCLAFGAQIDGSPLRGIGAGETRDLVRQAFQVWNRAPCAGSEVTPAFGALSQGEILCDAPEFNCGFDEVNYNTVMFRDDEWPYADDAIALTTLTVNTRTGELLDADLELNAVGFALTTRGAEGGVDLATVLTHEIGHFLGLSHSPIPEATMYAFYNASGQIASVLHPDDVGGICQAYVNDREDPLCELPFQAQPADSVCHDVATMESQALTCEAPASPSGCMLSPHRGLGAPGRTMVSVGFAVGLLLVCRRRRRARLGSTSVLRGR